MDCDCCGKEIKVDEDVIVEMINYGTLKEDDEIDFYDYNTITICHRHCNRKEME